MSLLPKLAGSSMAMQRICCPLLASCPGTVCAGPSVRRLWTHQRALNSRSRSTITPLSQHEPRHSTIPRLACRIQRPARSLHTSPARLHGPLVRPEPGTGIKVTFNDSKGNHLKTVEVAEGDNLLDIAHEYDVDLEGACEGSVACSTCHVILKPEDYDRLEEPSDEENDMLDMAFGLSDTSRLGCQVKITRELDGLVATLPSATRNMFVDGAKPGKH